MAGARLQQRLLTDHAFAIHMIDHPASIRDPPVSAYQLHLFVRIILDANMVNPEPLVRIRMRLFGKEIYGHADRNSICDGCVLKQLLHNGYKANPNWREGKGRKPDQARVINELAGFLHPVWLSRTLWMAAFRVCCLR